MADKAIRLVNGELTVFEATTTSAGAGDAGKFVGLDGAGKLDTSVMPVGIGADTKSLTASENLSAGDLVNVWNDADTAKARKADASSACKRAHGFVLSSVTSGATATVYFEGTITGLSSLTIAGTYFLSAVTPGVITTTAPSTAGHIVQQVGVAISSTELSFEPQQPITLA
jgi:hypothetical protein